MNFKERVLYLAEAEKILNAEQIYRAGANWKKFDFKRGLDNLIKADKKGFFIYYAGMNWKKFDYEKGIKILKALQNKSYYKDALKDWPKTIKQSQATSKQIKATAKKLPKGKKYEL